MTLCTDSKGKMHVDLMCLPARKGINMQMTNSMEWSPPLGVDIYPVPRKKSLFESSKTQTCKSLIMKNTKDVNEHIQFQHNDGVWSSRAILKVLFKDGIICCHVDHTDITFFSEISSFSSHLSGSFPFCSSESSPHGSVENECRSSN
jgi:hypothetical protein